MNIFLTFGVHNIVSNSPRPFALHCGRKQPRPQIHSFNLSLESQSEGKNALQVSGEIAERTWLLIRIRSLACLADEKPLFSPVSGCANS